MAIEAPDPIVAVWYTGLVLDEETEDDALEVGLEVMRVLYLLMGRDFDRAKEVMAYGKGLVVGPVHLSAAQIACEWIESVGGDTHIDEDAYEV